MPDGFFAFSRRKGKINTLSSFLQEEGAKTTNNGYSIWNIWYWPFLAKIAVVLSFILPVIAYLIINILDRVGASTQKQYVQNQDLPQTNSYEAEDRGSVLNWKTYHNYDVNFSVQYPPRWILIIEPKKPGETSQKAIMKGQEGSITFIWGDNSLRGECPVSYVDIPFKNMVLKACHSIGDESETWKGLQYEKNGVNFTVNAAAYAPAEQNREIVLKILSAVEF